MMQTMIYVAIYDIISRHQFMPLLTLTLTMEFGDCYVLVLKCQEIQDYEWTVP